MRKINPIDPIKFNYETTYIDLGPVSGTDEAGRGPLAGPVSVASVTFPRDIIEAGASGCLADFDPMLNSINDSKKISESVREALYDLIIKYAQSYSVQLLDREIIDSINILEATKQGMRDSILQVTPATALVDAVKLDIPGVNVVPIIKGDAMSYTIGAASILAKVTRDRIMLEMDELYPEYGFAKHKGYGTADHIEAIRKYGLTPIHRRSFCTKFSRNE
ncbi:MAG: ribonuclease HII [Clostridia bacterium]|nr:ribonuclease HII [Clostridia bacterium]